MAYNPPSNEALLDNNPYAGVAAAGGSDTAANNWAFQDFVKQFGRNPTQSELSMLSPSYSIGDPNLLNLSAGKAQIASYFNQLSQTPENLYNKQQDDLKGKAPQFYDQVNQTFQSNLGREATDAEKTHFGMLLASGQDPYEIQQALQQTTEYNTKQNSQFTDQLKGQLQSSNSDYFSKYIMPSIQAQNAQAGRSQDSSGYQAQLANAAQGQNYDLQNYLAQVSAQGYQGSVNQNANNYQALLGQQYGLQNSNISNQLNNQANNQQYNQNLAMYQMQQQAYNNYLKQYGKRGGWVNDLSSGLNLANSAANLFKGWGAFGGGGGSSQNNSMPQGQL